EPHLSCRKHEGYVRKAPKFSALNCTGQLVVFHLSLACAHALRSYGFICGDWPSGKQSGLVKFTASPIGNRRCCRRPFCCQLSVFRDTSSPLCTLFWSSWLYTLAAAVMLFWAVVGCRVLLGVAALCHHDLEGQFRSHRSGTGQTR